MDSDKLLGESLCARRELTVPEQAGLPPPGCRRTPEPRREEAATPAGVTGRRMDLPASGRMGDTLRDRLEHRDDLPGSLSAPAPP